MANRICAAVMGQAMGLAMSQAKELIIEQQLDRLDISSTRHTVSDYVSNMRA